MWISNIKHEDMTRVVCGASMRYVLQCLLCLGKSYTVVWHWNRADLARSIALPPSPDTGLAAQSVLAALVDEDAGRSEVAAANTSEIPEHSLPAEQDSQEKSRP